MTPTNSSGTQFKIIMGCLTVIIAMLGWFGREVYADIGTNEAEIKANDTDIVTLRVCQSKTETDVSYILRDIAEAKKDRREIKALLVALNNKIRP